MKHKSPNKNHKKDNSFSDASKNPGTDSRLYKAEKAKHPGEKLQLKDYLRVFPTCNQGEPEVIFLDEITVYYSFN